MAKEKKKTTAPKKKVATKKATPKKATAKKAPAKKTPTKKKVAAKKTATKKVAKKPAAKKATTTKKIAKKPVAKKSTTTKKTATSAIKSGKTKVNFEIQCKSGDTVTIAGSFNKWDTNKKSLKEKGRSGLFQANILLAKGEYEYKFCVNGDWTIDPENPNFKNNDMGTLNSFLIVE